jgi:DNA recombination-dependent growth factor C
VGVLNGSLALCRYRLLGAKKRVPMARLSELLDPYKAGPLLLGSGRKEEAVGWVRPSGIDALELPDEVEWDMGHCRAEDGEGFLLRMRIEKRRVPASLIQHVYRQKFFAAEGRSGKPPSAAERKELREKVKSDLMAKALPTLAHVDAFWRDGAGELLVFTTSKKARETFERLFTTTFAGPLDETLVRVTPPLMAHRGDAMGKEGAAELVGALGRLSATVPTAFIDAP